MLSPFTDYVRSDTATIAELVTSHASKQVLSCPGWDVLRLAGHVGAVHRMATRVVAENLIERPPKSTEVIPKDAIELGKWLTAGADRLIEALDSTSVTSPAWNFTDGPQHVEFWPRRMAHETSIHRIDACLAAGMQHPTSIAAPLAVDGIDEFLTLARNRVAAVNPTANLGGTLHLHATDIHGEWMIGLTNGLLNVEHGHGKGSAAVRGTASDLLLGLWARLSLVEDLRFERFGDVSVIESWSHVGSAG